jgi:excisionase family DNA binding protein
MPNERTTGAVVVPIKEPFTTTEAATMLGLARPTMMKLVGSGEINHVKVGTRHRIPAQTILDFQRPQSPPREGGRGGRGISNEIGLVD